MPVRVEIAGPAESGLAAVVVRMVRDHRAAL